MLKEHLALHKAYIKTELVVPQDESIVLTCDNIFIAPLYVSSNSTPLASYSPDEGDIELSYGDDIVVSSTVYLYHTNLNKFDSTDITYLVTTGGTGIVGQGNTFYKSDGIITSNRTVNCDSNILMFTHPNGSILSFSQNNITLYSSDGTSTTGISTVNTGEIFLSLSKGLSINNDKGSIGEVLVSKGDNLPPEWDTIATTSIYTDDGSITSNRTVDINTNDFTIKSGSNQDISEFTINSVATTLHGEHSNLGGGKALLKVETTGTIQLIATDGLQLDSEFGTTGQVLTSQGNNQPTWATVPDNNLYSTNGTIDGVNRRVDIINNGYLVFAYTDNQIMVSDTSVRLQSGDNNNGTSASLTLGNNGNVYLESTGCLEVNNSSGTYGQVLTSRGSLASPTWSDLPATPATLYYNDGTLTGDRVVTLSNRSLRIKEDSEVFTIFNSTGLLSQSHDVLFELNSSYVNISNDTNSYLSVEQSQVVLGHSSNNSFVKVSDNGIITLTAFLGFNLNGTVGTTGQVLTTNGASQPTWSTIPDSYSIYTNDNALSSSRILQLNSNTLHFKEDSDYFTLFSPSGFTTRADNSILEITDTQLTLSYNDTQLTIEGSNATLSCINGALHAYMQCLDNGVIKFDCTNGVEFNNTVGTVGQVLVSNGSNTPTWSDLPHRQIEDSVSTNVIPFDNADNFTFTATADDVTFTGGTVGQSGTIVIESADNITGWSSEFIFKSTPSLSGTEVFSYFIKDLTHIHITKWS